MPARAFDVRPEVISVNGVEVARDDIAREAQNHRASSPFDSWRAAARALVIRELLLQEARRQELVAQPLDDGEGRREADEESLIRILIERNVAVPEPDEQACRRYFEQNAKRFRSADLHEASHILFAAAPDNKSARAEAKESARRLIAELLAAPHSFEDAAALYSACSSAAHGGNLGQIGPGQTVPEFEAALRSVEEGTIHPAPIETRFGYHVVRLDRRIAGSGIPFDAVAPRIAAYLRDRAQHDALYSYVRWLSVRARITGIDIETGKVDPVAVAPATEDARKSAMRRFANGASAEDWTSLVGAVQRAEDPGQALARGMAGWRPPKPAGGATRPVFTYKGKDRN